MLLIPTPLKDAYVIEPHPHQDHRGFFMESYSQRWMESQGLFLNFVQDNHVCSLELGVLRGLHFQHPPHAQAKLVRVVRGRVYDVIVDLRKASPTYGQSFGLELTDSNFKMLLVPRGFAHGYCSLEQHTEFLYKVDDFYDAPSDAGILWNDPVLQIHWPIQNPILSAKDRVLPLLSELKSSF